MIDITIPGRGEITIKNILFDVNGTIAVDGRIDGSIKKRLQDITRKVSIYILTADTYRTIEKEMGDTGISIEKVIPPNEAEQKEEFVKKLGEKETMAIGNGANDALMLKRAILGMCVIDNEGASSAAIANADIVIYGKEKIFGLLDNPKRIVATLRS